MKKLMAMILTFAMVMSLCVVPASAAGSKVAITITPDKATVDTTTGDAVVTYTVKAKVTDPNLKVGALTITLDPGAGLTLAEKTKKNDSAFYYEANSSLFYHESFSPSGIFEAKFDYAPTTKTFVAVGATLDRNLNSSHGEVVLMTIMGKIAQGTTGTVTLGTTVHTYGDTMAEASHDCDVTPATVTILKAPIDSVTASVEKPVAGQALATTVDVGGATAYTGTVKWYVGETEATGTTAKANTEYTAKITLTASSGESFAEDVTPTVAGATISGKSVTDGGKTLTFNAKFPATDSLPAATVTTAPAARSGLKYNGSEQVLLGTVGAANGGTMQYSLDNNSWSDAIPKGKDAKTYTVYYMVKGDSTHSDYTPSDNTVSVKIDPKEISGVTIGTIADQPYTGSAITPDPEVKDGATKLEKGKDYTVSCANKYVGTAELTITGTGNYTGTKTANFTITAVNQNPTFDTPASLVKGGAMLDLRTLVQGAKGEMTFTIAPGTTSATLSGYTLTSTGIKGEVKVSVSITAKDVGGDSTPEYNAYTGTNAITVNVIDKTSDTATMKVSQSDITYGGSVSPSVTNKPAGTGEVSYTYEGRDGTSYSSTTAPTNVGKYKVKAKCESSTTVYTAEDTFEILPKSISGMTVTLNNTSLEYNGSAQTVNVTVKDGSTTLIKDTDYTVTSGNSGTNVGSYTVTVTGKGNYTGSVDRTWKITQGTPTYTVPTGLTATFGQKLADITLSAGWSWMDSTQPVGDASTTPKTFKAKFTPADTTNYKTVENIDVSVAVSKADAPTLTNITVSQKYTVDTEQSKNIGTAGMPADAGALTYTKGTASKTGSVTVTSWAVDATTGKVTYTLSGGKVNDAVTLPVTIGSSNYADATVNVVITLIKGSTSSSGGGSYYAPVVPDMPMVYWGCTGDAVKTLQDKLNALGYNSGNVDGIFGAKTYAAVTAFQKANSLGVDGIVGKLTWGKLYGVSPAMPVETTTVVGRPMVSYGSRGDAVRKLQELLNALGYDCGSVDGIFGSKTKAAVLAFQKANGLGVDGIVGPLTWAKLG